MIKKLYTDLKKYWKYAFYAAKADLKSEVSNSYLNWVWWILEPFCLMLIYTFIFGYVFKASELYFPVFIFVGLSLWSFFSKTMTNSVDLIRNNKGIISKVYLPKYILLVIRILINGFKLIVSFAIVVIMMILYNIPVNWNILFFIPFLFLLFLVTFCLGSYLLHVGVFINDLSYIVAILLNFLMYLTGIFYDVVNRMPQPIGKILEIVNPIAFVISNIRKCLLYEQTPDMLGWVIWTIIASVLLILGIKIIYNNENTYVKVI